MEGENRPLREGRPPLTPAEQGRLRELQQRLASARERERGAALAAYEEAHALLQIRDEELWMDEQGQGHRDFLSWARERLGQVSRFTVWRRLRVACAFPEREQFLYLIDRRKLSFTALQIIASAPAAWRDDLLDVAASKSLSTRELERLLDAAELRHQQALEANAAPQLDPDEAALEGWHEELVEIIDQQRADHAYARAQKKAQAQTQEPERRQQGRAAEEPAQEAALRSQAAALDARARALEEERAALQAQLADRTAALDEEAQALAAERARLLLDQQAMEEMAQDLAVRAQVLSQGGDVDQALESAAVGYQLLAEVEGKLRAAEARLQALAGAEAQQAAAQAQIAQAQARLAELLGEEAAARQRLDALRAAEAGLKAERAAQQEEALRLSAQELALSQRARGLDEQAARQAAQQAALERNAARARDAQLDMGLWMRRALEGQYRWDLAVPETLDCVLLDLGDAYARLQALLRIGDGLLEGGAALERLGFDRVAEVTQQQHQSHGRLLALVERIAREYAARSPARASAEMAQWEAARVKPGRPEVAALPQPPRLVLPTEVILGEAALAPGQWGVMAVTADRRKAVGYSLNQPGTIVVVGLPGFGKTQTATVLVEMMARARPNLSVTPRPMPVLVIHWGKGFRAYPPDLRKALLPNREPRAQALFELLGAQPEGIGRLVVWVPALGEGELAQRREEYQRHGVDPADVRPLRFTLGLLGEDLIRILMKADKNSSEYMALFSLVLRRLWQESAGRPTLSRLREELGRQPMDERARAHLEVRLAYLGQYIDDERGGAWESLEGAVHLADLRSALMNEQDAALVVPLLMRVFTYGAKEKEELRGIYLNEGGKLFDVSGTLRGELLEMLNEIRHRETILVLDAQSPEQLPDRFVEEAKAVFAHRVVAADAHDKLKRAKPGFALVDREELARLEVGEAVVVSEEASTPLYMGQPIRVRMRASLSMPGGSTVKAAPSQGELGVEEPETPRPPEEQRLQR